MGGFKQNLRRHQEQQRQSRQQEAQGQGQGSLPSSSNEIVNDEGSKLANLLIQKWAWGRMSLPLLQSLAAAGVHDGLRQTLLRPEAF